MALWTRPDNPPADVVQIGGHSVETVRNITHGLFVQFEVGDHSDERAGFLTFEDQQHPMETPSQTSECCRSSLKERIVLMKHMQPLVRTKYEKPLMVQPAMYAERCSGDQSRLY